MSKKLAILGAGGFAREVRWLADEITKAPGFPDYEFVGYVVRSVDDLEPEDKADEVAGDEAWLAENQGMVDAVAIGIGMPAGRLKVAQQLEEKMPGLEVPALVHPSTLYDAGSCTFHKGSLICARVTATVNVTIEPYAMVNLCCTLGHEARVGRGAVLNPTVNISGGVTLEEGVLVGTGAQVLQNLTVGSGATVGGGAVVTKNVEPGQLVVGMPAKPLKR